MSRSAAARVAPMAPSGSTTHSERCEHDWRFLGPSRPGSTPVVHANCQRPNALVCVLCAERLVVRCGTTRMARCEPCALSHRRRLVEVVKSGVTDARYGRVFWVTLTAPGVDTLPWAGTCGHASDADCSGVKGCRVERYAAAMFNGSGPRRWSWFMTYLRRALGDVQYCGVWEFQERGVLHRHFVMVVERPLPLRRVKAAVRYSASQWGFGAQYDVQPISGDVARNAWYVAKYAGKTAACMADAPRLDVRTGEWKRGTPGFRAWSASRRYGDSMRTVKERQCRFSRTPQAAGVRLDDNSETSTPDPVEALGLPAPGG